MKTHELQATSDSLQHAHPPQVPDEKTHPSLRAAASSRRPPCSPTRWSSTWPSRPTRSRTCPPTTSWLTTKTRLLVTSCSSMHWSMKALATAMLVFTSASLCWHEDDHNTGQIDKNILIFFNVILKTYPKRLHTKKIFFYTFVFSCVKGWCQDNFEFENPP